MSIKAWPFLVSRNKRVGYSTVLTPDFVLKANATNLLANAAGDEKTKLGVVFYREIHDSRVGSIGLLFRIVNAKDKKGNFLKDALGRSIEKIEGWVFDQTFPSTSIGISDQEMDLAHRLVEPIFNLFWEIGDKNFMQSSEATVIQEITNTNLLLEIVRLEPYVTVKPKEKNFVSDVIKQDDGKQKRSKDLTRKPDKLISRSPFGTGQWKHSQFRVEGPIAELAFIPSTRYVAVLHTNFRYLSVVNCIKGTKKVSATKLYNQANFGGISVNSKGQLAIVNNPPYLSPKNHSEVWFLSTSFDNDAPTSHLDRLIS